MKSGYILGIAAGYHDSAASLVKDGKVLGSVEEERFTGIKHDDSFPQNAIEWLFREFNVDSSQLEAICFYETPSKKINRIEESTKRGGILNTFLRNKIIKRNKTQYKEFEDKLNELKGEDTKLVYIDHHDSHAAYSFFTSPHDRATILSVDGVGEWETTSTYYGEGNKLTKLSSVDFPHSLGMIYSAFTAFLGFKPNEGEYKVMGLAPYGNPQKYLEPFKKLYTLKEGGKYEINMDYFTYDWDDKSMFNEKLGKLFELPNRLPDEELTQDHKDLAATLQHQYEFLFFKLLDDLYTRKPTHNLCLSGGCAYNGTANGKILEKTNYKKLWIPPAPSDAGSAIGCALYYYYEQNPTVKRVNNSNPYLGPSYNKEFIKEVLDSFKNDVYYIEKSHSEIISIIAKQIYNGNVVGWFEGRLEFGARALGNRSILGNPCDPQMKSRINKVVKKREGFRPFAPIVKYEAQTKYFDYKDDVPYMNQVVRVREEHQKYLPAITHVDGSARIQSLKKIQHKRIYDLLNELEKLSGYPIVLNTSFNLKDQTMVMDPTTAIETFLNCEMDTLVLQNFIVKKKII